MRTLQAYTDTQQAYTDTLQAYTNTQHVSDAHPELGVCCRPVSGRCCCCWLEGCCWGFGFGMRLHGVRWEVSRRKRYMTTSELAPVMVYLLRVDLASVSL